MSETDTTTIEILTNGVKRLVVLPKNYYDVPISLEWDNYNIPSTVKMSTTTDCNLNTYTSAGNSLRDILAFEENKSVNKGPLLVSSCTSLSQMNENIESIHISGVESSAILSLATGCTSDVGSPCIAKDGAPVCLPPAMAAMTTAVIRTSATKHPGTGRITATSSKRNILLDTFDVAEIYNSPSNQSADCIILENNANSTDNDKNAPCIEQATLNCTMANPATSIYDKNSAVSNIRVTADRMNRRNPHSVITDEHRTKLLLKRTAIVENMIIQEDTLKLLLATSVITLHHMKTISSKATSFEKVACFLDILLQRPDKAFMSFLCVLKATNQKLLAKLIEQEDTIPNTDNDVNQKTNDTDSSLFGENHRFSGYTNLEATGDGITKQKQWPDAGSFVVGRTIGRQRQFTEGQYNYMRYNDHQSVQPHNDRGPRHASGYDTTDRYPVISNVTAVSTLHAQSSLYRSHHNSEKPSTLTDWNLPCSFQVASDYEQRLSNNAMLSSEGIHASASRLCSVSDKRDNTSSIPVSYAVSGMPNRYIYTVNSSSDFESHDNVTLGCPVQRSSRFQFATATSPTASSINSKSAADSTSIDTASNFLPWRDVIHSVVDNTFLEPPSKTDQRKMSREQRSNLPVSNSLFNRSFLSNNPRNIQDSSSQHVSVGNLNTRLSKSSSKYLQLSERCFSRSPLSLSGESSSMGSAQLHSVESYSRQALHTQKSSKMQSQLFGYCSKKMAHHLDAFERHHDRLKDANFTRDTYLATNRAQDQNLVNLNSRQPSARNIQQPTTMNMSDRQCSVGNIRQPFVRNDFQQRSQFVDNGRCTALSQHTMPADPIHATSTYFNYKLPVKIQLPLGNVNETSRCQQRYNENMYNTKPVVSSSSSSNSVLFDDISPMSEVCYGNQQLSTNVYNSMNASVNNVRFRQVDNDGKQCFSARSNHPNATLKNGIETQQKRRGRQNTKESYAKTEAVPLTTQCLKRTVDQSNQPVESVIARRSSGDKLQILEKIDKVSECEMQAHLTQGPLESVSVLQDNSIVSYSEHSTSKFMHFNTNTNQSPSSALYKMRGRRGRPKKNNVKAKTETCRPRGRPKKNNVKAKTETCRPRGRPKKNHVGRSGTDDELQILEKINQLSERQMQVVQGPDENDSVLLNNNSTVCDSENSPHQLMPSSQKTNHSNTALFFNPTADNCAKRNSVRLICEPEIVNQQASLIPVSDNENALHFLSQHANESESNQHSQLDSHVTLAPSENNSEISSAQLGDNADLRDVPISYITDIDKENELVECYTVSHVKVVASENTSELITSRVGDKSDLKNVPISCITDVVPGSISEFSKSGACFDTANIAENFKSDAIDSYQFKIISVSSLSDSSIDAANVSNVSMANNNDINMNYASTACVSDTAVAAICTLTNSEFVDAADMLGEADCISEHAPISSVVDCVEKIFEKIDTMTAESQGLKQTLQKSTFSSNIDENPKLEEEVPEKTISSMVSKNASRNWKEYRSFSNKNTIPLVSSCSNADDSLQSDHDLVANTIRAATNHLAISERTTDSSINFPSKACSLDDKHDKSHGENVPSNLVSFFPTTISKHGVKFQTPVEQQLVTSSDIVREIMDHRTEEITLDLTTEKEFCGGEKILTTHSAVDNVTIEKDTVFDLTDDMPPQSPEMFYIDDDAPYIISPLVLVSDDEEEMASNDLNESSMSFATSSRATERMWTWAETLHQLIQQPEQGHTDVEEIQPLNVEKMALLIVDQMIVTSSELSKTVNVMQTQLVYAEETGMEIVGSVKPIVIEQIKPISIEVTLLEISQNYLVIQIIAESIEKREVDSVGYIEPVTVEKIEPISIEVTDTRLEVSKSRPSVHVQTLFTERLELDSFGDVEPVVFEEMEPVSIEYTRLKVVSKCRPNAQVELLFTKGQEMDSVGDIKSVFFEQIESVTIGIIQRDGVTEMPIRICKDQNSEYGQFTIENEPGQGRGYNETVQPEFNERIDLEFTGGNKQGSSSEHGMILNSAGTRLHDNLSQAAKLHLDSELPKKLSSKLRRKRSLVRHPLKDDDNVSNPSKTLGVEVFDFDQYLDESHEIFHEENPSWKPFHAKRQKQELQKSVKCAPQKSLKAVDLHVRRSSRKSKSKQWLFQLEASMPNCAVSLERMLLNNRLSININDVSDYICCSGMASAKP